MHTLPHSGRQPCLCLKQREPGQVIGARRGADARAAGGPMHTAWVATEHLQNSSKSNSVPYRAATHTWQQTGAVTAPRCRTETDYGSGRRHGGAGTATTRRLTPAPAIQMQKASGRAHAVGRDWHKAYRDGEAAG